LEFNIVDTWRSQQGCETKVFVTRNKGQGFSLSKCSTQNNIK